MTGEDFCGMIGDAFKEKITHFYQVVYSLIVEHFLNISIALFKAEVRVFFVFGDPIFIFVVAFFRLAKTFHDFVEFSIFVASLFEDLDRWCFFKMEA